MSEVKGDSRFHGVAGQAGRTLRRHGAAALHMLAVMLFRLDEYMGHGGHAHATA